MIYVLSTPRTSNTGYLQLERNRCCRHADHNAFLSRRQCCYSTAKAVVALSLALVSTLPIVYRDVGASGMDAKLSELRQLLPDTVHDQLVSGGEPGLTVMTLRRWLVARKWDVHAAAADLTAHAGWRAAWVPNKHIHEREVLADLAHDKYFLQGTDRRGRGVGILKACRHSMTEPTAQQRYIIYCIDGVLAACDPVLNPEQRIVAVFELQGLSIKNLDATGLRNIFGMLQQHFVEHLDLLVMVGAPALFWGLWRLVCPFIDPVTRQKVVFVGSNDTQLLLQELGPEVLPPHLGGTGKLIRIQDAVKQQQQQQAPLPPPPHSLTAVGEVVVCHGVHQQELLSRRPEELLAAHGPGLLATDAAVLIQ